MKLPCMRSARQLFFKNFENRLDNWGIDWYSNKAVRQGGGRLEGSPKGPKKTVDKREPMW